VTARLLAAAAILSLAACGNALTPRDRAMFGLPQNVAPSDYCGSFEHSLEDYCQPPDPPDVIVTPEVPGRPRGHFMSWPDKQRWVENCTRLTDNHSRCVDTSSRW
jgi:hypothetical protein